MVLGMKTNSTRRSTMLQTEYKIHLKEIKPWPPSQSLNSLRSVLIQWQNGTDQISGTTTLIVPTQPSIINEGKIEFNQSFNISISLPRMMSIRSNSFKAFQKNCLEFNLYEPRRDNVKGLLLASASIDFAEYGILKETISANLVMNCKRNFRNVTQPILYIDIEPMKINGLRSSLSMLIDKRNGGDSVLELMSEEYAKEAVVELVAADDDGGGSSHSSLTVSSSAYEFNDDSVDPIDEGNLESAKNDASLDLNDTPAEVRTSKTEQIKSFSDVVRTKLTSVSMDEILTDDNNNVLPTPYQLNKSVEKAQQDINLEKNGEQETEYVVNITESIATKHVKSVRSLSSFSKNDTSERSYNFAGDTTTLLRNGGERKELRFHSRERSQVIENRVRELEKRVKILETELREAAAIEIAIYSVIADHGKSEIKIHTPARRLSRLYIHAYEENSQASAAKSSVSGLVLVAKACGNDVTRLMYWLSNCVVLRSIITLATGHDELPLSTGVDDEDDEETEKSSSLNDDEDFINMPDWSDPQTYTRALEKVESWIFCRIIESLWWQTLVPYMQCYEESFDHIHITSLMNSRIDNSHDHYNFPVELWNEAFKEVSERLCPVRATKHECGCLQMLSQLVIEQCVARLDVSMFNAILRESADEVPTDPLSDPISDVRVLPVPVGKSSFGAGAQLKNATGNWSRSLNELFNLRDREFLEDETERNDGDERQQDTCTKFFYHLNTLSDLMMLPKDLLLDKSVRKEVCPTLGSQLIKRLLNFHVPDEFCTDLVPVSLLESLDREDFDEFGEECISHVPCAASPPIYRPPVADSLECIIGNLKIPEVKNSDLLLIRKAYTSDDEIDELQSPLSYMLMDGSGGNSSRRSVKEDGSALRYQLLKEVWRSSH